MLHNIGNRMGWKLAVLTSLVLTGPVLAAGPGPRPRIVPGAGAPTHVVQHPMVPKIAPGIGNPVPVVPQQLVPRVPPGIGIPANPMPARLGIAGDDVGFNGGVAVTYVYPGWPADGILEPGDVIVQAHGQVVRNGYDLRTALLYAAGPVRLLVRDVRTGGYQWVFVRL